MSQPCITTSRPLTAPPDTKKFVMHTHEAYELYCFLSGDAEYYVEGTVYPLESGDILIMKKAEAHSLLIKSAAPYERVVVHFSTDALPEDPEERTQLCRFLDDRPLGQHNRYPAALYRGTNWHYYMEQIHASKPVSLRKAYLTVLLSELSFASTDPVSHDQTDLISQVIRYINTHLTEDLSLELICREFFLSKAQINRRFKKATGSTVWEYVLTKRLLLARELLQKGEAPTAVSGKSGFRDYCTFFRAYKSTFGVCPRADYKHTPK